MNIMHTMASEARTTQAPKRRFYSPEFKLQVVGACAQPGASIAGLALEHGINANIVHRWLREHSQGILIRRQPTFVPVTLSAATEPATAQPTADIRIEVKRVNTTIVVHWPLAGGAACAQWLRECLQ
ncbi:IS66-like element accessory protein TnpA [Rhodoferax ferrireducens]|uniref:IS66-like element accessory protein TnpA n=1 Tax=Rhodoferax ferrireducens TaxID=192843 RepID=UPI0018E5641D|nr:transposase [Rhodoferax ferrireducens]